MEYNIFLQISALLAVTVGLAFIIRALKQPLLAAYLTAGLVCGPLFLNLLDGGANLYQAFADFGVVLLLFVIALDLNFSYLKKIGRTAVSVGLWQFALNFILTFPLALSFGLSWRGAIFLSLAACFSSTIVILKLLNDKQDEESVYGRYTIALLLVQDLISIGILTILSFSSAGSVLSGGGFVGGFVGGWLAAVPVLAVVLLIVLIAKFILPRILEHIAASGEFLFIFTVAWCFGVASLMRVAGFSLEIGAIAAGLSLGSSRYHLEIGSRVKPLRDFFLVLFFIILGSRADFSDWSNILVPAFLLAALALTVKPFILYNLFRARSFTRRNSFLSALTSSPLSEFGFIILFAGAAAGYLDGRELGIFTVAAIITIFLSSYSVSYGYQLYEWCRPFFKLFGRDRYQQPEDSRENFEAIIFGCHRTGQPIAAALKKRGMKFAVVDFNPDNVSRLVKSGQRAFFGDASDIEFLAALPLASAKLIISTVPSPEDQAILFDYVRSKNKKAIIIASLYHKKYADRLYLAGADYILLPYMLSGAWLAEIIKRGDVEDRVTWRRFRREQAASL
jgi:Kef-type K+ transport system membrane component KefB